MNNNLGGVTTLLTLGAICGGFGFTKEGTGVLVANGAGTLTGPVALNTGTLRVNAADALGTTATGGALTLTGGTTLAAASGTARSLGNPMVNVAGNVTIGDAVGTGILSLTGVVDLNGGIRTITTTAGLTLTNVVQTGGLIKLGTNTLTLSGANTFSSGLVNDNQRGFGDFSGSRC